MNNSVYNFWGENKVVSEIVKTEPYPRLGQGQHPLCPGSDHFSSVIEIRADR